MMGQTSSLVFLNYLTTVFDNLDEAILLLNVEANGRYRFMMANERYKHITGRDKNPVGELVSDVVAPETFQKVKKRYDQVVQTKEPTIFTDSYRVPLGIETYEIKLIPVLNSVGQVVQIAGIVRNITELQRLREAAKRQTLHVPSPARL